MKTEVEQLIQDIEEAGYVIRRDGVVLGKDGFRKPPFDAHDPYSVEIDLKGKVSFMPIDLLVMFKYNPPVDGKTTMRVVKHRNSLKSDSSVDNIYWVGEENVLS